MTIWLLLLFLMFGGFFGEQNFSVTIEAEETMTSEPDQGNDQGNGGNGNGNGNNGNGDCDRPGCHAPGRR